jgi:hypothetical protein
MIDYVRANRDHEHPRPLVHGLCASGLPDVLQVSGKVALGLFREWAFRGGVGIGERMGRILHPLVDPSKKAAPMRSGLHECKQDFDETGASVLSQKFFTSLAVSF